MSLHLYSMRYTADLGKAFAASLCFALWAAVLCLKQQQRSYHTIEQDQDHVFTKSHSGLHTKFMGFPTFSEVCSDKLGEGI